MLIVSYRTNHKSTHSWPEWSLRGELILWEKADRAMLFLKGEENISCWVKGLCLLFLVKQILHVGKDKSQDMRKIHGQIYVMLQGTNSQNCIRRGSKEIKIWMFSYILWESFGFFYSSTGQLLKWDSMRLWEGASIAPSFSNLAHFSPEL